MRARTYDGNIRPEDLEYVPLFVKCDVCECMIHEALIVKHKETLMDVCPDCMPGFLESIENESDHE